MGEKKIGVYVCEGCGIGSSLDVEKLLNVARSEMKVPVCRRHAAYCTEEGLESIKKDLDGEGVNGIVLAACSPRVLNEVFQFPDHVVLERVNLREQVAWCLEPGGEDTQMAAEDYLRMGIVKVQKSEPLEPFQAEVDKTILVVGGGVAGMTAALEAARAGYGVVLVEKEERLGGWMARQFKRYPFNPPYRELEGVGVEDLISKVGEEKNIRVICSAEIQKIQGAPGMFDVFVKGPQGEESFKVGAIVQATGWKPYDPTRLGHLGYGAIQDVVTNIELEEMMAKTGEFKRPSNGSKPQTVVFIQCAGSRDPEHLPYCSSVCCMVSLKQALYLKGQDPSAAAFIVYKEMRTPGQYEEFYRRAQKEGVVFVKGEVASVAQGGDGKIAVEVDDMLTGEKLLLEADMVVLATGMVPSMAVEGDMVKVYESLLQADQSQKTEQASVADRQKEGMVLHLDYRQGPELPKLFYGMPDSHFICFPYETRRTGIYAAGCVRQPMDMLGAEEDGRGAALKAIQCVEMTSRGEAVHPRAGDRSWPEFFMQRCTQCKRCTEECPFGAINEDEKANPLPNPTRCRRCSICMGSCPERIISFKDYSVDMIGSMIKAIEVPEEEEEKPRVIVLACENDAYPALDILGQRRLSWDPYVRVIPLRCLGSLNLIWIADALSKGIDGVLLLGCKHGEDYQCHMIKGSELAQYRLSKVSETLDRLALESDRVRMEQVEIRDYKRIPSIVESFMERIREIGPNPYKGF
jgi:quinone-modifying oxidoreductase subunit QmoB